jgi:hypothetical protein
MDIIITPYRWYNQYHKQNRFDRECSNTCEFKLITHRSALLPFQFTRSASPYAIDKWLLRPACKAYEPTLLETNESKFISPFNWNQNGSFQFDCSVAKISGADNDSLELGGVLTIGIKYRITFSCTDLLLTTGSTQFLSFHNGGGSAIVNNVNALGFYEAEFTATSTDVEFVLNNSQVSVNDFIGIKDVQIFEVFKQESFDIELDKSLIQLKNFGVVDYFVYCGAELGQVLPVGDYYSIIIDDNQEKNFSEIITVRDFLPEKSPYYILKWENTCDINNVLYQDIDCDYYNLLYLDEAILTKPEYPFKEEGEEDGNQDFNATFQKWEKRVAFIIGKCPEFIVDALTAIRLHETILLTSPLRKKQLVVDDAVSIKSVDYEVLPIFNDCFSNVQLNLLLHDKYIDSTCCNNNEITPCVECENAFNYYNDLPEDATGGELAILIGYGEYPDGLYQYDEGEDTWVFEEGEEDTIYCMSVDEDDLVFIYTAGAFQQLPSIYNWGTTSYWFLSPTPHFHIEGYGYPGSYIQIEISDDGGASWTKYSPIVTAAEFALLGVDIPFIDDDNLVKVRAHNFTLNCDYGYSDVKQINMVGDYNNDYNDDFFR